MVCLRSAVAAAALWLVVPDARRGYRPAALLAAVPYAATLVLFVTATKLTTAANAIFLQSTAPLYLLALAPAVLGEPVRRRDIALLGCMLAGLALVAADAPAAVATAPAPRAGNLAGAASGLTWALTVVGLRGVVARDPAARLPGATFVTGNVLAALAAAPAAVPLPPLPLREALVVLWLGVFQIGLGYLLLGSGVRGASAMTTAMLLLLEPMLNPLWVWLLHGEVPGTRAAAGGAVILVATAVQAVAGDVPARAATGRGITAPPC